MATIDSQGAAFFRRITLKTSVSKPTAVPGQPGKVKQVKVPAGKVKSSVKPEEARVPWDSSSDQKKVVKVEVKKPPPRQQVERKRMTFEEHAAMLRKVHLTLDLFEIQAKFTVNPETGEVSVVVINQRTGEVIREIPPYKVAEMADALLKEEGIITDIKA